MDKDIEVGKRCLMCLFQLRFMGKYWECIWKNIVSIFVGAILHFYTIITR